MNADASQIGHPNFTLVWLLTIGFVGIAFTLVLVKARRWTQTVQTIAISGVVSIALVVIVGFIKTARIPHPVRTESFRVELSSAGSVPSPPPSATVEYPVMKDAESSKSAALPEWTRLPSRIDGRRKLIVVSSGRFASEREAELHGFQQAAVVAVNEYSSLDPRGLGAVQPQHADLIKDTAIKQRFLETTEHDFGKFKAPMHQLWLQIELTPELGNRLAEPWREAAVAARLRTLTNWSLWSTAAAALAAFSLRLDAAWQGRRRAVIVGTAIALTLGSLAILA